MDINKFGLSPSATARALSKAAVLLVLASIGGQIAKYFLGHGQIFGLVNLFYVDEEKNIPSLFSTLLLLCSASLLAIIAILKNREDNPDTSKWAILAGGFLFMSVDEAWSIHEQLVEPFRGILGTNYLGVFHYAWVIPGIAVVLLLAPFFVRFLLRLPATPRFRFILAGALYIGGAIGLELIGGYYDRLHGHENFTYSMIATIEESLEMAGLIVFIRALLEYIADSYREVHFLLHDSGENSQSKVPTR